MVDKADESLERLISAARAFQPDAVQETDYFETRLMARIPGTADDPENLGFLGVAPCPRFCGSGDCFGDCQSGHGSQRPFFRCR